MWNRKKQINRKKSLCPLSYKGLSAGIYIAFNFAVPDVCFFSDMLYSLFVCTVIPATIQALQGVRMAFTPTISHRIPSSWARTQISKDLGSRQQIIILFIKNVKIHSFFNILVKQYINNNIIIGCSYITCNSKFSFSKACGFQILCLRSEKEEVNSKVSGCVLFRIKRVCGLRTQHW